MSYTVSDLIDVLENMDPDAEVRIAEAGYRTRFEYDVDDVVQVGETSSPPDPDSYTEDEKEEYLQDYEAWEASNTEAVVYLAQGTQLGYLPSAPRTALGW